MFGGTPLYMLASFCFGWEERRKGPPPIQNKRCQYIDLGVMHTVKKGLNDISSTTSLSWLENTVPPDDDAVSQKSKGLNWKHNLRGDLFIRKRVGSSSPALFHILVTWLIGCLVIMVISRSSIVDKKGMTSSLTLRPICSNQQHPMSPSLPFSLLFMNFNRADRI